MAKTFKSTKKTKKKVSKKTSVKKSTQSARYEAQNDSMTSHYKLDDLLLDNDNPRLGAQAGKLESQVSILDEIVNTFGVDDVLSSLAVNGYFEAEPMVGVREGTKIRIKEGNRRLAACLILIGDKRAKNQAKRTRSFQELQERHGVQAFSEVPVRILTDPSSLLSYLGVRHIAASQPWDSFAKAAWIAKVLEGKELDLTDVTEMIGDQHNTVARILEGYYFVNQLINASQFIPGESTKRGRGSNTEYPFSWVYTTLGYAAVREWLGLADLNKNQPSKKPIKSKNKENEAAELMVFLFGNKNKSRRPAISDSRQISDLARAVGDPDSLRQLKRGKSIEEVTEYLKPAKERVEESLYDAREALELALSPLSQDEISVPEANDLLSPSRQVRSLAISVNKQINEIVDGDE